MNETLPPAAGGIVRDSPSAFAAELIEMQPFSGYQLSSCLSSDDRRAVFRAESAHLGRAAAIKVMRPSPLRSGAAEEFFSLAGGIARLRCPGLARGLDAGRGAGCFFMAYELVPGESLASWLGRRRSGRAGEKEALRLVLELARRLRELFDSGNHHGNLKPENIMLSPGEGGMRLLDMGFSWTLAWPDDRSAHAASPHFLPPERIAGELGVDIRGDLYSLGAIWHWLLLGEPVFRASTPEETLRLHLERDPVPPRERDPRLSAAASGLIMRLLARDRRDRPRTPLDFIKKAEEHPLFAETVIDGAEAGTAAGT